MPQFDMNMSSEGQDYLLRDNSGETLLKLEGQLMIFA